MEVKRQDVLTTMRSPGKVFIMFRTFARAVARLISLNRSLNGFRDKCTDEQHAMSSHELQTALMLKEFSKMYYTR
jgi:hypothetical protein